MPTAPRGVRADDDVEQLFATWKAAHQAKLRAEFENDLAKSAVRSCYDKQRADYFIGTFGTVPMQMRGGTPTTDWQALARALIPASKLEKHVPRFTTLTPVVPTLAAPSGWAAELGLTSRN